MATNLETTVSNDILTPAQRDKLQAAETKTVGQIVKSQIDLGTLIFLCLTADQLQYYSDNLVIARGLLHRNVREAVPTQVPANEQTRKDARLMEARVLKYRELLMTIIKEVSRQFSEEEINEYMKRKNEIPVLVAQWFAL